MKIKRTVVFLLSILLFLNISSVATAGVPKIESSIEIGVGGSKSIPCDLSGCEGTRKTWSANGDCISISNGGVVKGLKEGTGSVMVSTGFRGETATCSVRVLPPASVSISQSSLTLNIRESKSLSCSISPSNASKVVKWSSSNTSVASVDDNGNVTATGIGSCTVTCASQDGTNASASCSVRVERVTTTSTTKRATTKRQTTRKQTTRKSTTTKKQSSGGKTTRKSTKPHSTTRQHKESNNTTYQSEAERVSMEAEERAKKAPTTSTTKATTTVLYRVDEGETTVPHYQETGGEPVEFSDGNSFVERTYNFSAVSKKKRPIVLSWKEIPDIDGYQLYRSTDGVVFVLVYDGTSPKYEQHFCDRGRTYYYYVRSYTYHEGVKMKDNPSDVLKIKAARNSLLDMFK